MYDDDYVYSDLTTGLEMTPMGEFKIIYDEEVLEHSIRRIMSTISGERVRSVFGSSLMEYLFETLTEDTISDIRDVIFTNISTYEPRVNLEDVLVQPDYDNNAVSIEIRYSQIGLQERRRIQMKLNHFQTV